jgi:hypothetical protein
VNLNTGYDTLADETVRVDSLDDERLFEIDVTRIGTCRVTPHCFQAQVPRARRFSVDD